MKCTSCGNTPNTVGDIQDCKRCNKDGVAKQIPVAYPRDTPLAPVVARTNGLENRFLPGGEPYVPELQVVEQPKKKSRVRKIIEKLTGAAA